MASKSNSKPSGPMAEPPLDCPMCPRLVDFRDHNQIEFPTYHNAPVSSFGGPKAKLLIVGLAPGLHGANKTSRPFTGDYAGDLLYDTLARFGFSSGTYDSRSDDGLKLIDCMITNAVRCVPPKNKPIGAEISTCRPFLKARIEAQTNLKVILCLGRIAHESVLRVFDLRLKDFPFGHGVTHKIADDNRSLTLIDSYHCSRYNTNTKRLTGDMFDDVFRDIQTRLG